MMMMVVMIRPQVHNNDDSGNDDHVTTVMMMMMVMVIMGMMVIIILWPIRDYTRNLIEITKKMALAEGDNYDDDDIVWFLQLRSRNQAIKWQQWK